MCTYVFYHQGKDITCSEGADDQDAESNSKSLSFEIIFEYSF